MNNTMNILSKIAKACLIIISLLTMIGAIVVIGICIDISEQGGVGSFDELGNIFASVINSCSFTRAMTIAGFAVSIASLIFSVIAHCSRAVAVIDTVLGTLCFIFGMSLSPLCSLEDMLGTSMSNIDAEDFGVGIAIMLIFLVFFSVVRIILNIVALALRPKVTLNTANMAYGYNPQMSYPQNGYQQGGYAQNGYQQGGYPQNGFQQGGYPQAVYPQNGFQQNAYPQNTVQYPQNGFQQNNYVQQPVNMYQGVNATADATQNAAQSAQGQQDTAPAREYAPAVQNSAPASYSAPEAYVPPVVQAPETNVNSAPQTAETESWLCSNCGATNTGGSKFCQNCGMQK